MIKKNNINDKASIELLPVHTNPNSSAYNSSVENEEGPAIHLSSHVGSSQHHNFSTAVEIEREELYKSGNGSLLLVDKPAFYLLVLLYFLQGIPVGLAFGSIPFLMKSAHLSYSQLGTFSLASYPYSLKLFWSPFVDSFYSKKVGRRRSWIIPVQTFTGLIFIILGSQIDAIFKDLNANLNILTFYFFLLVLMASTQDIAVDSWALVILSPASKSYASTAQTVGLNTGYFLSFTVFLAFNSKEFMNKYFRSAENQLDVGLFTLGQYMIFSGFLFLACTAFVALKVPEVPEHLRLTVKKDDELTLEEANDELDATFNHSGNGWHNLKRTYLKMYRVLSLSTVQQFIIILLICKIGFLINESATNLKLLDRGFAKEDLSLTVLIDFPFEIIFGYYVAKWSRGKQALNPWLYAYIGRLIAALFGQLTVYAFPTTKTAEGIEKTIVTLGFFLAVIIQHLFSSLMSTIQFVSLAAFHTRIADPTIGGTYMTTLNTLSNFGGTWPKFFLLKFIDRMTYSICAPVSLNTYVGDTVSSAKEATDIISFELFWANTVNFVKLAADKALISGQKFFPTAPKPEELKLLQNFKPAGFNFENFFKFISDKFQIVPHLTTFASLTELKNNKVSEYIAFTKGQKIDFWEASKQASKLPGCATEAAKQVCLNYLGGECIVLKDGYYMMNLLCVSIGTALLVFFIWRKIQQLQSLGESHWRVK